MVLKRFAEATLDAVLARPAEELIAALVVGFALSLCSSGAYLAARRWVADVLPLLVALMLLVSVASATLAVGYVRCIGEVAGRPHPESRPPNQLMSKKWRLVPLKGRGDDLTRPGFEAAVEDRDGIRR